MNRRMVRMVSAGFLGRSRPTFTASAQAQDAAALYKAKCSTCHADDGSSSGQMGKTLGATDLRSDEVQKQTDAPIDR